MTAELRSYEQSWRDRLAAALIGDARAGGGWGRFVESSVGSTGLGNSKMSLIDLSPLGMVLSGNEAVNAARDGNYGEAALDALGAVPGGAVTAGISKAGRAVKQAENIASRIIPVYDPPVKPPRPFELDYPKGAPADEAGNLTHDIDGRLLTADHIVGRRVVGGNEVPLQPSEIRSIGEKTTGRVLAAVPQRGPGGIGSDVGRVTINRYTRFPEEIQLRDNLTQAQAERVLSHEVGHVVDQAAGEIPITGLSRELRPMYNTLNTGRERTSKFTGPEHLGYKGGDIPREYMADAIRAYMSDPNYIKTVSPKTAARIREYVNSNPKLKNIIQFNSLAAGGVGAAAMMPDDAKAQDMSNWWESAPLVENQQGGNGNWWDDAPLVDPANPTGQQQATFDNDGTVGPTNWRKDVIGHDGSISADNVSRTLITSAPVIGPLLGKAGAAIDAALDKTPIGSNVIPGETWRERYDNAIASQRGKDEAFGNEHPYVQGGLNVAGGVVGTVPMMMAAPAAFGMGGGSLFARSLASGASGMALGGTDAAIRSDFDPKAISLGAGGGLVMGGIGPAAGQAIGAGARKIADVLASRSAAKSAGMVPSALRYLNTAATRDGLDAPAIQQRLADLGPDAMLMDLAPNMKGAAAALANHPGDAQTVIRDALMKRQAGANQRIIGGLDDALGPVSNPRAINEAIREGQRATGPAYGESFKNGQYVDTSVLATELDGQAFKMRGPAQKAAQEVRSWLNMSNADALDSNPYTLFQTRNAIDGKLATETNPQAISVYTNARKQIDDTLARNVPGIKMADAQFQELARQNEGLRTGLKALDSGREALRPDELQQAIIEGVNPEGLMVGPSAQTFRMQQAARADIDRQVGTKANDVVALKNVMKGEGDWNRDRIGMLFGQERADKALSLLEREARYATTNNDVTGNSFTAARLAAQKDLFPSDAPSFGLREAFAAGGVRGAARNVGTRAFDRLVGVLADSGIDARNAGLGEALAGNKQAVLSALEQLQGRKDVSPQIRRLVQAMMLERGIKAGESAQGLISGF